MTSILRVFILINNNFFRYLFLLLIIPIVGLVFFTYDYIPRSSPIDDELYLSHAISFINGIVENDEPIFFSKSFLFGYFLFLLKKLNISLFIFLYIMKLSLFYIWYFIFGRNLSYIISLATLGLLIFHPLFLSNDYHFVIRDQLNALLIILNIFIIFLINKSSNKFSKTLLFLLFFFSITLFNNLREENFIYFLFITIIFSIYFRSNGITYFKYLFVPIIFYLVCSYIFIDINYSQTKNDEHYYSFLFNVIKIKDNKNNPKFILTNNKIQSISDISITFDKIKHQIPSPHNESYTCKQFNICDEWSTGFMIWWIKDLPKDLDYSSRKKFYSSINDDIDYACRKNLINCSFFPYNIFDLLNIYFKDYFINLKTLFFHNYKNDLILKGDKFKSIFVKHDQVLIENTLSNNIKVLPKIYKNIFTITLLIPLVLFSFFIVSFVLFCKNLPFKSNNTESICYFLFIFASLLFISFISIFIGPFDIRMFFPIIFINIFFTLQIYSGINK